MPTQPLQRGSLRLAGWVLWLGQCVNWHVEAWAANDLRPRDNARLGISNTPPPLRCIIRAVQGQPCDNAQAHEKGCRPPAHALLLQARCPIAGAANCHSSLLPMPTTALSYSNAAGGLPHPRVRVLCMQTPANRHRSPQHACRPAPSDRCLMWLCASPAAAASCKCCKCPTAS